MNDGAGPTVGGEFRFSEDFQRGPQSGDEWEFIAKFLWRLLDNIDTASDMAKDNDRAYREFAEQEHRKRFQVGSTDGYAVRFSAEALKDHSSGPASEDREGFEKSITQNGNLPHMAHKHANGKYLRAEIQADWDAWQASRLPTTTVGDDWRKLIQDRIDYHDVNGSMAEAADMPESAAHHDAIRKELEAMIAAAPASAIEAEAIAADVVRLVIAARNVAFGDQPTDAAALKELDTASEAFADRVPWDDEPRNTHTLPHHGGELAGEFERLAKAATQGPASAQGWEVCGEGGTIADCDSDKDADFIAFCFSHRAEISSALSAHPGKGEVK